MKQKKRMHQIRCKCVGENVRKKGDEANNSKNKPFLEYSSSHQEEKKRRKWEIALPFRFHLMVHPKWIFSNSKARNRIHTYISTSVNIKL